MGKIEARENFNQQLYKNKSDNFKINKERALIIKF